jgi:hypothetical protein
MRREIRHPKSSDLRNFDHYDIVTYSSTRDTNEIIELHKLCMRYYGKTTETKGREAWIVVWQVWRGPFSEPQLPTFTE